MNNKNLETFAASFAALPLTSLVEKFNSEVGNQGWTSMRAAHDVALIREFENHGVDISAVYDGQAISFAHRVAVKDNKLIVID